MTEGLEGGICAFAGGGIDIDAGNLARGLHLNALGAARVFESAEGLLEIAGSWR